MDAEAMDNTIAFGMGFVGASLKRTRKGLFRVLGMLGFQMEIQGLSLKKGFGTMRTRVIGYVLVLLHVIMHRILTGLDDATRGANEFSCGGSEIGERHYKGIHRDTQGMPDGWMR